MRTARTTKRPAASSPNQHLALNSLHELAEVIRRPACSAIPVLPPAVVGDAVGDIQKCSRIPAKNEMTIIPHTHLRRPASPPQHFEFAPTALQRAWSSPCLGIIVPTFPDLQSKLAPCTPATEQEVPSPRSSASRLSDPLLRVASSGRVSASAPAQLHC